ncbi:Piwi-like protein 1 [Orchesella cincta]|uniref:Piwi-like protein 1 n=1 Tax=Orchesella cincta TaxID=48709 RepID=A0A1D2NCL1_ORCCI|nr:Piwi-like protein 1 [Orchesella cincta]
MGFVRVPSGRAARGGSDYSQEDALQESIAGADMQFGYVFDGTVLYTPKVLGTAEAAFTMVVEDTVGENSTPSRRQLGLLEMGRNFFDPVAAIDIPAHRLTLWPGLERSFGANQNAFREAVKKELNGTIVMTTYNRKTYHIDDIEFDKSPQSMFERKGEQQTLTIKDLKQPLLKAKASKRDLHAGKAADPGDILLVPELCQSTGLTDNMRANFSLMKELSKYLHQAPQEKGPVSMDLTSACGSTQRYDQVGAGQLGDGVGREAGGAQGSHSRKGSRLVCKGNSPSGRQRRLYNGVQIPANAHQRELNNMGHHCTTTDFAGVDNLVRTMTKVAAPLSMAIGNPKQIIKVPDARSGSYLSAMEDALNLKPQMIFVILPNNKAELYNVVKKRLAVDKGVPSQCFLAKNVTSKGLMSIATKVVVQMNAKLGGEPWTLKLPLKSCMFVGFDVYHGAKGSKGGSVGAMVATFSANFTKYFSTTSLFKNNDELCETMLADLIKCCHNFQEVNGELPERIIMYRDGVGEGQLKAVYNTELTILTVRGTHEDVRKRRKVTPTPHFHRRIQTGQHSTHDDEDEPPNPPPGTIVDEVVTLPERYDFYLISCAARQGTVSPCSYNVLQDENNFDADRIQLITYKLCHMYYNWSGTIAVPAPCQYAHKLPS